MKDLLLKPSQQRSLLAEGRSHCFCPLLQEQVSESTTSTILDKLLPDTRYSVTVVPVYAEGDGPSLSDNGKTSE